MRHIPVSLDIWKWDGLVCLGGTVEEFSEIVEKGTGTPLAPEAMANAGGLSVLEDGKPWLIWVEDPKNLPTLAHEALHITSGVLSSRGLQHTSASEEAYTYTMTCILDTVLKRKRK